MSAVNYIAHNYRQAQASLSSFYVIQNNLGTPGNKRLAIVMAWSVGREVTNVTYDPGGADEVEAELVYQRPSATYVSMWMLRGRDFSTTLNKRFYAYMAGTVFDPAMSYILLDNVDQIHPVMGTDGIQAARTSSSQTWTFPINGNAECMALLQAQTYGSGGARSNWISSWGGGTGLHSSLPPGEETGDVWAYAYEAGESTPAITVSGSIVEGGLIAAVATIRPAVPPMSITVC